MLVLPLQLHSCGSKMLLVSPAALEQQLILIEAMVIKAEEAANEAGKSLVFAKDKEQGALARNAAEACRAAAEARLTLMRAQELYLRVAAAPTEDN